jgi:hypothetical protein
MVITLEDLIVAIRESTKEIKVCVPSSDYYARPGDVETERIDIIDPALLVEHLTALLEDR